MRFGLDARLDGDLGEIACAQECRVARDVLLREPAQAARLQVDQGLRRFCCDISST
jgi:hypothetical protein